MVLFEQSIAKSEGVDEIEPLGILDDVSTIVNITCGYQRDEFGKNPVYLTIFSQGLRQYRFTENPNFYDFEIFVNLYLFFCLK